MDQKFKRRLEQILNSIDVKLVVKEPKKEKIDKVILESFEQELDKELVKYFESPKQKLLLEKENQKIEKEKKDKVKRMSEYFQNLEICDEFDLPLPQLDWTPCIKEKMKRNVDKITLKDVELDLKESKNWNLEEFSNPNHIWKHVMNFVKKGKDSEAHFKILKRQ